MKRSVIILGGQGLINHGEGEFYREMACFIPLPFIKYGIHPSKHLGMKRTRVY